MAVFFMQIQSQLLQYAQDLEPDSEEDCGQEIGIGG